MRTKRYTLYADPTSPPSPDTCAPDVFASTVKGTTTIYLCKLYFSAKLSGTDSKMGILVHKLGHAAAYLDDVIVDGHYVYGQAGCKDLAKNHPGSAVKNADNYEYFTETQ